MSPPVPVQHPSMSWVCNERFIHNCFADINNSTSKGRGNLRLVHNFCCLRSCSVNQGCIPTCGPSHRETEPFTPSRQRFVEAGVADKLTAYEVSTHRSNLSSMTTSGALLGSELQHCRMMVQ
eukprot:763897-Hanusia_phi.AAC.1